MSAALTPWFPGSVKPVHIGVYNTKSAWGRSLPEGAHQYWDGKRFKCTDRTALEAYECRGAPTDYPNPEWRGLAADPQAVKP